MGAGHTCAWHCICTHINLFRSHLQVNIRMHTHKDGNKDAVREDFKHRNVLHACCKHGHAHVRTVDEFLLLAEICPVRSEEDAGDVAEEVTEDAQAHGRLGAADRCQPFERRQSVVDVLCVCMCATLDCELAYASRVFWSG